MGTVTPRRLVRLRRRVPRIKGIPFVGFPLPGGGMFTGYLRQTNAKLYEVESRAIVTIWEIRI